ncbi:terminase endonuclease subunit [Pseudomonas veronii]|uniref:phage terminase small subunit n=1 Tax=Pseudomonas veronii TaxID=76761 RepID=UPI0018E87547|nr:terminase endonuclease subunit [Pseudomonas veronii]MBJ2176914.1 terminase endonuclease subunit [Pseudomonas veronii]
MANSLAKRHYQRVTAAIESAATEPTQTMAGATAYEHQLNQLLQDRLRLKQVQSNQGKAELKRQLLPSYESYVQGVLEGGQGAQDEVLTTVMVWRFDAGDFTGGLDIATYVLEHKMVMPDRFARTLGCLVAEEVATAAFKAQKVGEPFDLAILHRTAELTDAEDMPDQARAKLFLAMGRATLEGITEEAPGQPGKVQAGVDLLKKAIALHDACGGKKDLERAERLLNKLAGPTG